MKYMLIMRATDAAKDAYDEMDFNEVITAMGTYNEQLINAGVLLAGEGLSDDVATTGFVVDFSTTPPTVTDGPYGETHELFNGFWILQVGSKEEAAEWASRCPLGPGSKLEVRRVTDESDFAGYEDNEYLQKEAGWRAELGEKA
ncbi:YciI family protein [Leifsonia sp. F6_8S_P_1B]|uniref:YciI family protein n=1 Tax=Leifsonia williamsii TaxID=3035919 RepID=A0ABT8K6P5_9MICO|nr:YciI family protein [Leifsonia williamsii]MDN4613120.1 YciI family protein [Leifsonia williamsii]